MNYNSFVQRYKANRASLQERFGAGQTVMMGAQAQQAPAQPIASPPIPVVKELRPQYAQCSTTNNLMSCSILVLSGMFGGVDDCLVSLYNAIYRGQRYGFVVWSDAVKEGSLRGEKIAEVLKNYGNVHETPPRDGAHGVGCPVKVWCWDLGDRDGFVKYIDSRRPELEAKYG